ncbi:MAG TPA: histidine phosphatase family protein [Acidimicrobiia bacterium]
MTGSDRTGIDRIEVEETELLLVRHGQSTWNALGRWQGQADPPLSELGERQAAAAARRLADPAAPPVARVVTSDLVRARRTAEVIADALGVGLELEPRLRERHAGEWTGLTRAEIDEGWPGALQEWRHPAGFETDDVLLARVLPGLHAIVTEHARDASGNGSSAGARRVVVITHGGVVRTLERHLGAQAPPLANLGARAVRHDGGRLHAGERVLLLDGDDAEVTVPKQI